MSTLAALRALHSTIGSALTEIERVYEAQCLDYPALDVPSYQNIPADSPLPAELKPSEKQIEQERLTTDPAVANAINLAVAAGGQLLATLQQPLVSVLETSHLGHITAALSFLEASNVVEILRGAGPEGLHAQDIARKIEEIRLGKEVASDSPAEYIEPAKLSHVLRLLATQHWLREVKPDVFANNRLSSLLDSGKTLDQLRTTPEKKYDATNGLPAFVGFSTSELFRSVTHLRDWLLPARPTDSQSKPKPETPFHLAYNTEEGYYAWLERPENASRLAQVGSGMAIARAASGRKSIADTSVFPWDKLPKDSVVVDVGGGIGSVSVQLAEPHPHLRLVVQDRAQTVAIAPKMWGDAHKDLFDSGRISFQAQDFFEPQPPALQVPGAGAVAHPAAYLVTRVMHNWPDVDCVKILVNLRAAAGPDTKLIVHDMILQPLCAASSAEPSSADKEFSSSSSSAVTSLQAPLENWGKAVAPGHLADITMLTLMNARERTLEELRALTLAAGWKITDVDRSPPPMPWGYIVAVPV
ncbi:S-adenosyl-L-methionine-dependent methyltransferase [Cubamyces sp. BRFM 1775]|nr:S-adenosyl-L-methionine-dependent methyltransferase [Cubamyces sp. BRFM 1775]